MRSQQSCCRRRPQCTRPAFAAGHGQGILITFLIYPERARAIEPTLGTVDAAVRGRATNVSTYRIHVH